MTENSPEKSLWTQQVEANPGHSAWYIERWRTIEAAGEDIHGEARLVDAMAGRGARILDAGCGTGRVGGELARRGHTVVGVDGDPALIAAAAEDHPDSTWLVQDLAALDLTALPTGTQLPAGVTPTAGFDLVVCAGNVMTFLAPSTRRGVLDNLAPLLAAGGRAVFGFGAGRGYEFDDFRADAEAAGFAVDLLLSTWGLRPLTADSDFLVAVLRGS